MPPVTAAWQSTYMLSEISVRCRTRIEKMKNQDREPTSLGGHGLTIPLSSSLPIASLFWGSAFNPKMPNSGARIVRDTPPKGFYSIWRLCVTRNKTKNAHQSICWNGASIETVLTLIGLLLEDLITVLFWNKIGSFQEEKYPDQIDRNRPASENE